MEPVDNHAFEPDASFDSGELDCGNGLLLLIRKHLDRLEPGQLLEIRSTETSVEADLPAWCRLTKNELLSFTKQGKQRSFLVCKGQFESSTDGTSSLAGADAPHASSLPGSISTIRGTISNIEGSPTAIEGLPSGIEGLPSDIEGQVSTIEGPPPEIEPLSVMGVGSWPRPRWMVKALHEHQEGKLGEEEFQLTADDAVRLCVEAQLRAGADVLTDGEQRRDNYSSFVGGRLENCQLIPLIDLLPLVDDPEKFEAELNSLDVPATKVRHPAVFGKLKRTRSLAVHEFEFMAKLTDKPIKVALPGPYLLSRTMWMECISDKAYDSREALAEDIVKVLKEEVHALLAEGVSMVQLDEPVLTEVVFTGPKNKRSFMCGALSERGSAPEELEFALGLLNSVVCEFPRERLAMHVCRGNWTTDESVALSGDYRPLLPVLQQVEVGTLFLEFCTPRAGDLAILKELPEFMRVGLGVVNPKDPEVESVDSIVNKVRAACEFIDIDRLLLSCDCGFATFADNPVTSAQTAEAKLKAMANAQSKLR